MGSLWQAGGNTAEKFQEGRLTDRVTVLGVQTTICPPTAIDCRYMWQICGISHVGGPDLLTREAAAFGRKPALRPAGSHARFRRRDDAPDQPHQCRGMLPSCRHVPNSLSGRNSMSLFSGLLFLVSWHYSSIPPQGCFVSGELPTRPR